MASRAVETGVLRILDGSRGLSDYYPPRLEDNQLSEAWDVEFWDGAVCGRRWGCIMRIGGTGTVGYSLYLNTPSTRRADDRLAVALKSAGLSFVNFYDAAWAGVSVGVDDTPDFSQGVDWASLHGKLFLATKSAANRLHVYSPSWASFRATGIKAPAIAPSTVNIAGTQTYFDVRQFRVRFTRQVSGVTTLRSEPGPAATFTPPAGNCTGCRVGYNTPSDAWATHWELEEISGGNWYRTFTSTIGTIHVDTTIALALVPTNGVLSEDIGDYSLQYSARWLTVDEDRLLMGGSFDEEAKSARVSWTPIGIGNGNGSIGVGNDERIPTDVDSYLDFDMLDGGGLTGLKAWEGKVIVFKRQQVHQMVRNSSRLRAYLGDNLSRRHGAIPHSIVEGTDVDGLSCLYFLDPEVGPMQLGFKGLRVLAPDLQRTWRNNVNLDATEMGNIASVTYHAEKRQVWWHIATGSSTYQNIRWMYSVESDGVVFHTTPAPIKSATSWLRKPTLLYDSTELFPILIGQGDIWGMTMDYDNVDYGAYRAYVVTKGYQLGQLLRRFQIDSAVLEANAVPVVLTGEPFRGTVYVTCRRDFGVEARSVKVTLGRTDADTFEWMVVPVDNSYMTEAITMQFEIGDIELRTDLLATWQIHGLTLAWSLGSPTTGRG
jgi:hypothetical protein